MKYLFLFLLSFSVQAKTEVNISNVQKEQQQLAKQLGQNTAKKYSVIIYSLVPGFTPERLSDEVERLQENFHLPVLTYQITNVQDFENTLLELTKTKKLIANLVFRGISGENYKGNPDFLIADTNDPKYWGGYSRLDEFKKLGIKLNFTADAFIFMTASQILDESSPEQIKKSFQQLQALGLESGWIYTHSKDSETGIYKSTNVIAYLINRYYDKGYLYGVSTNHQVLLETGAYNVVNGTKSGTVLYTR